MAILVHGQDPTITGIVVDLTTIEGKIDTIDTVVDNIHDTDLPAVKTDTAALVIDVNALQLEVSTLTYTVSAVQAEVDSIYGNRMQVLQVQLTEHADAGDVTLGTVDGSVLVESIVVKTITTHGDLTSIAVTGGAGKVLEFISAITGAAANLNAADKQVSWTGSVELGDSKTIMMTFAGTGAGAVAMTATIKYRPCTITGAIIG